MAVCSINASVVGGLPYSLCCLPSAEEPALPSCLSHSTHLDPEISDKNEVEQQREKTAPGNCPEEEPAALTPLTFLLGHQVSHNVWDGDSTDLIWSADDRKLR